MGDRMGLAAAGGGGGSGGANVGGGDAFRVAPISATASPFRRGRGGAGSRPRRDPARGRGRTRLRGIDRMRVRALSQRCVEFPSIRRAGCCLPCQQPWWARGMCHWLLPPADAPSVAHKIRQRRSTVQPFVRRSPARLVLLSSRGWPYYVCTAVGAPLPGWWNADTASLNLAGLRAVPVQVRLRAPARS